MTTSSRRPGLRRVLARLAYRRLVQARAVSQARDVVRFTPVALLVLQLIVSGLGVSWAVLAEVRRSCSSHRLSAA